MLKLYSKEEYREEIEATASAVAEAVADDLKHDEITDEDEISNVFSSRLHEHTGDHGWGNSEDKAFAVLLYAKNPCAEWDSGIQPRMATDDFPWVDFAGAAIEADVRDRAIELLAEQGIEVK